MKVKVLKQREFYNVKDFIDWLCFYEIQPQQIMNSFCEGGKTIVIYWMEFEEN